MQVDEILQKIDILRSDPRYISLYAELRREKDEIRWAISQRVIEALYSRRETVLNVQKIEDSLTWELRAWIMEYSDYYSKLLYNFLLSDAPDRGYMPEGAGSAYVDPDVRAVIGQHLSNHFSQNEIQKKIHEMSKTFDMQSFELLEHASYRPLYNDDADIEQIGEIYHSHTLPASVFEDLRDRKYEKVQQIVARGAMVHLFAPTHEEIRQVQKALGWSKTRRRKYKSPMQQLRENLSGRNGMAGEYRVLGMFDESGTVLLAWVSFRLPPKKPTVAEENDPEAWNAYRKDMKKYEQQVIDFFEKKAQMDQGCDMDEIRTHAGATMEIDTISSDVPGGGTAIMNQLLETVHEEYPGLKQIYLVRYGDMRIVGQKPRDMPNYASGKFFRQRDMVSEGHIFDKDEVAWRKADDGFIFVHPKWIVMRGEFADAHIASRREWRQMRAAAEYIRKSRQENMRKAQGLYELFDEEDGGEKFRNWLLRIEAEPKQADAKLQSGLKPIGHQ